MKKKLINIAIDGHSSCGKSSIAKCISKEFNMTYIDSGAMYRAITLYCIENEIIFENAIDYTLLLQSLKKIDISFNYNIALSITETFLNGKNVEHLIRDSRVSDQVSSISKIREVRDKLIDFQQKICSKKNVVMDGRDIGTKVMPDADVKFFITADVSVRAQRRFDELKTNNKDLTYAKVLANLNKRDSDDVGRKINPLLKAVDAIVIDNTFLSFVNQNELVFNLIKNHN
ncbi:(d)CMP kinase [Flavobacteriales bacterium]|jgi:CMP/dCMP kinase|nr:(d)CMP kinase [Flavobacteriales bacterium]|tara:strand:- start:502 stop:1191 length:690 start_codon:yes stop_codon:yes gene_type:complete